jgi:hypothetical protein
MKFERRMRAIQEKEYYRRVSKLWAPKLLRETPIEGESEVLAFLLSTATIEPIGPTGVGGMAYESMMSQPVVIAPMTHGKGIQAQRDQLEDLSALKGLAEWVEQITIDATCYKERLLIQMILNGGATDGSAAAYDGQPFFVNPTSGSGNGHYFNPFRKNLGSYYNDFTGSASGSYPGALPIHDALIDSAHGVTLDAAVANLGKALAAIANVKMPNGITSRKLRAKYLLAPKQMAPRVQMLLDAKYIAMAAVSATGTAVGGTANIEGVIEGFGLSEPIISEEIGAAYTYQAQIPTVNQTTGTVNTVSKSLTGSDTDWFLVCEEAETSQLGGFLHVLRRAFEIRYFTGAGGMGEGERAALALFLSRARMLEYQCDGRESVQYGHPYTVYRFQAT